MELLFSCNSQITMLATNQLIISSVLTHNACGQYDTTTARHRKCGNGIYSSPQELVLFSCNSQCCLTLEL